MRAGRDIETKAHCHVYHTVCLFFSLQGESPENGSFLGFGWRLLGILGPKSSNVGLQRLLAMRKARIWRAFLIEERKFSKKQDCLAGDAVQIAPVSGVTQSPIGSSYCDVCFLNSATSRAESCDPLLPKREVT
jgi:hypothetical protein